MQSAPDRWNPSANELAQLQRALQALRAGRPPARTSGERGGNGPPLPSYDDLSGERVIEIVTSLEADALEALARDEASHRARRAVLAAIGRTLSRQRPSGAAS